MNPALPTPIAPAMTDAVFALDPGSAAAGSAGHRRRGADQYRAGTLALGRAGAAGQPGHCGRYRHRLCASGRGVGRYLRRRAARATPFSWPASPGTGWARGRFCWAASARRRHSPNWRCSSSFWPSPWPRCIPWGSGADRWRLTAGCAAAAVLAATVFPLLAHWVWGGGWLAQLGVNFVARRGLSRRRRRGYRAHVLGGLSALAVVWIAGPRKGKFPKEGFSTAMPGHNAVYVLFGCLLALVGWLAWNVAGAVLWLHAPLAALPVTAVNTLLSASGALAATFAVTRIRFGKPDASLCANGWLAGLVASSACAGTRHARRGALRRPRRRHRHAAAGRSCSSWRSPSTIPPAPSRFTPPAACGALLAAGIFAPQPGQLLAQLVGIAALLGLVLPLVYLLFWLLNRVVPFRVDPDGERIGMDLHELGGGAYPEFVIHRDESYR